MKIGGLQNEIHDTWDFSWIMSFANMINKNYYNWGP